MACVKNERADPRLVLCDIGARPCQDVRRVIAHEIVETPVVVAPVFVVETLELVEESQCLVSRADSELEHCQLLRQRPPHSKTVPDVEQLGDDGTRCLPIRSAAPPPGQRLFVAMPGCFSQRASSCQ